MKTKIMSLIFIIAVIAVISGCINQSQQQQNLSDNKTTEIQLCNNYKIDGKFAYMYLQMQAVSYGFEKNSTIIQKYNTSLERYEFFNEFYQSYNDSRVNDYLIDLYVCQTTLKNLEVGAYPSYPVFNSSDSEYEQKMKYEQYQAILKNYNEREDNYHKKVAECSGIKNNIEYRIYLLVKPRYDIQ